MKQLRMPLDTEHLSVGAFESLDHLVTRVRTWYESLTEFAHRLVMERIDGDVPTQQRRNNRLVNARHVVRSRVPIDVPLGVPCPLVELDVLIERASVRDVDQLESATDGKHW
jgi:hypothetical protein